MDRAPLASTHLKSIRNSDFMISPYLQHSWGERIMRRHGVAMIDALILILQLSLDRSPFVGYGPDGLREVSPNLHTHETALDPLP